MDSINSGGIFNRNCMQLNKIRKQPSALLGHKERDLGMYRGQDGQSLKMTDGLISWLRMEWATVTIQNAKVHCGWMGNDCLCCMA